MTITERLAGLDPEKRDLLLRRLGRSSALASAPPPRAPERVRYSPREHGSFALQVGAPGILDSLRFRAEARRPPGPGEVELELCAFGLNFRDVMIALGIYPTLPGVPSNMGSDGAGRVVAVGPGVEGIAVGDEVLATTSVGFRGFTTVKALAVARKPPSLSFEEAASIPTVFFTAYFALRHVGRLARGERVLVHAAAGGVGMAAVQIAQWIGAEVYGTAGSPAKRDFLKSIGVEHVMDSRSLEFAQAVKDATNGEGVDVVLNSLAGEFIPKSLALLRPFGRFLEIGKRDIYQDAPLGLFPFHKSLSFCAIDLAFLPATHPALFRELMAELLRHFDEGVLRPLPMRVFPMTQVAEAFGHMAQAQHIGKIVLSRKDEEPWIAA
jgi:NADPH:quinone reductase-like Zn-dependent oxidoreductase